MLVVMKVTYLVFHNLHLLMVAIKQPFKEVKHVVILVVVTH